jgi:hypothetical protein
MSSPEETERPWRDDLPEVLLVVEGTSPGSIRQYFETGELPRGAKAMSFEEYSAQGRVSDCDCNLISCVCVQARQHKLGCRYQMALTCAIPIACEAHGSDVCPTCDACTCLKGPHP